MGGIKVTIDFTLLNKEFSNKIKILMRILEEEYDINATPYEGYVPLSYTAKIYCIGRKQRQIEQTIEMFSSKNRQPFLYISSLLEKEIEGRLRDLDGKTVEIVKLPGLDLSNWGQKVKLLCRFNKEENGTIEEASDIYIKEGIKLGLHSDAPKEGELQNMTILQSTSGVIPFLMSNSPCAYEDINHFRGVSYDDLIQLLSY